MGAARREADVEFLEPEARLDVFLANGEGSTVEFKREMPGAKDGAASVMKTIAAFANGAGGAILFGIDDDRNPLGLPVQSVPKLRDLLAEMARSWVIPAPALSFETLPTMDASREILVLSVMAGTELYACGPPGTEPNFFIRNHATTVRARASELEAIVLARTPPRGFLR